MAVVEHDALVCGELVDLHSCEGFGDEGVFRGLGQRDAADFHRSLQFHLDSLEDEVSHIAAGFDEGCGRDQPAVAERVGCADAHASMQFKVHKREAKVVRWD